MQRSINQTNSSETHYNGFVSSHFEGVQRMSVDMVHLLFKIFQFENFFRSFENKSEKRLRLVNSKWRKGLNVLEKRDTRKYIKDNWF